MHSPVSLQLLNDCRYTEVPTARQFGTGATELEHKYEKQRAENRSLMHTDSNPKLLAVLNVDKHAASNIQIHALDDKLAHSTSQHPNSSSSPKNFSSYTVESLLQINKDEVERLVSSPEPKAHR